MGAMRFYVCDGNADGCAKTFCKYNGTGDCQHTKQKGHARYGKPREWETPFGPNLYVEKVREPIGS